MENKMTIVVVNDFDYIQGGASKVALDTAELLHKNNYDVILFSATHKENNYNFKQVCTNQEECLKDGIKGALRGLKNKKVEKEFSRLLDSLDRSNTIIHVHGWTKSLSSVIFKVIAKKKFKMVLTVHDYFTSCPNGGYFNYKKNSICKKKAMSFDCIKTNCDSRNYLIKLYRVIRQKIQNKNLKKINGNCIYVSDFIQKVLKSTIIGKWNYKKIDNPIDFPKKKFSNSKKNDDFVYVGRLSKEKGIDLFCEAITKASVNGIIIGDGSEKERLEKQYTNIKFLGWKNKEEISNILLKTRTMIFPSLWYEAAGMTALEAQSIGIPVIVANECATSDYIKDNINGLIFESGNVDDLVQKIKKCDDKLVEKMSKNSYDMYWKKPYDNDKYIKELKKYYLEILKASDICG